MSDQNESVGRWSKARRAIKQKFVPKRAPKEDRLKVVLATIDKSQTDYNEFVVVAYITWAVKTGLIWITVGMLTIGCFLGLLGTITGKIAENDQMKSCIASDRDWRVKKVDDYGYYECR